VSLDKSSTARRLHFKKRETEMKKRSIYRLLVHSEEKSILEVVLYALLALSALAAIWQFADEPGPLPLYQVQVGIEQPGGSGFHS
jgi:hypothetical protein